MLIIVEFGTSYLAIIVEYRQSYFLFFVARRGIVLKRKAYALGIAAGELEKMLRKAARK